MKALVREAYDIASPGQGKGVTPYQRGRADVVFSLLVKLTVDRLGHGAMIADRADPMQVGRSRYGHYLLHTYGIYWELEYRANEFESRVIWRMGNPKDKKLTG